MGERKYNYRDVFRAGTKAGFRVTDVRQYFRNDDGLLPRVEQTINTPWTWKGMSVVGYADTDVRADSRGGKYDLYDTNFSEFYIRTDEIGTLLNLDDLMHEGDPKKFSGPNGSEISPVKANEKLKEFASAACEYPHVFMHDEWMIARSAVSGRFGLEKPTSEDYERIYLPAMEQQLADPAITIVGRITRPQDIHIAYESSPLYQEEHADAFPPNEFDEQWLNDDDYGD